MERLVTLSTVFCAAFAYVSYDNYKVYKVYVDSAEKANAFRNIEKQIPNLDLWGQNSREKSVDVMVSPTDEEAFVNLLEENEIASDTFIEDVGELVKKTVTPSTRSSSFNWTAYHTYDTITEWMETLPDLYPDSVSSITIGQSYNGVDIKGVRVALNPDATRVAIFEAGIHAREWITPAATTYILNELLTSTDERVRSVAESLIWYVVPVTNPDGYNRTFNENRMHRKNVQEVEGTDCSSYTGGRGIGTDLNRNFDYSWMEAGGASDDPCSETFAGTSPFSAPEAVAIKTLVDEVADNLVLYMSIHSYSQLLLFPYGHTTDPIDNYYEQYAIGRMAMDALEEYNGTKYVVGNTAEAIYIATGSSTDWVKGTHGTRLVYCYELRDTGRYGFLLPADQIIDTSEEALNSIVVLVEQLFRLDRLTFTTGGVSSLPQSASLLVFVICLLYHYIVV